MIGTQVGRYRIDSELGRGGMGVVYRGTQVTLDRTVAIKMLPAHLADAENRERFRLEALTLARLAHPNIVYIYDVEEQDGHSFIVMEHVGGGSLGDLLHEGPPVSPARAVEIVAPVLSALHAAHLAGVVHRDIKPDNILFTGEGRPKLTDFGIAHMRDAGRNTRTGVMLGTPYYMSPEQARGKRVTAAADLYAVGVVLYEMLSGRVPFLGEDALAVALMHMQDAPEPLGDLRPDLPGPLCEIVHRALEKVPGARFSSAAAMKDALESGSWAPGRVTPLPPASGGPAPVAAPGARRETGRPGEFRPSTPVGSAAGSAVPTAAAPAPTPDEPQDGPADGRPGAEGPGRTTRGPGLAVAGMAATGRRLSAWLARPGPRGFPMAFWAGSAAVTLVALWAAAAALDPAGRTTAEGGAGAVATDPVPGREAPDPGASSPPRAPAAGGGAVRASRPPAGPGRAGPATLSAEEIADLNRMIAGDEEPSADTSRSGLDRRLEALGPPSPGPAVEETPRSEPEPREPSAREQVRAIVDRQLRAVREGDRALFLRDIHPDARPEAAAEFDLAYAGATDIRSTISDLGIEFLDPDHAFVTFDVDVSFVVRADGRTVRESFEEAWDVVREGGRWWIVAWN